MSYSIHIIKTQYPWESNENPITLEEWTKLIETDSEMKIKNHFESVNLQTREKIAIELKNTAIWTFKYDGIAYEVAFTYNRGKISVSWANDYVKEKMKKIADKLSCRVVGDEGEEY